MNAINAEPIAADMQLQTLESRYGAEAGASPDSVLTDLCGMLRHDLQGGRRFGTVDPQSWASFDRDNAVLQNLVHRVADTPAKSRAGLRAKALALQALLDEGAGDIYDDAAAPDVLAWSLVRDILAE